MAQKLAIGFIFSCTYAYSYVLNISDIKD